MTAVAVVFDCDGVLVDSEPHSIVSWLDVLSGVGHPAGASDVEACAGLGFAPTYGSLSEIAPLPPPDEVFPILLAALRRSFSRGLRRFPDTVAVLNACIAAGFPVAVASSSPRARLELTLEMAGIAGLIGVSVAGDEVVRGKPAPDVYLAAARHLGVEPSKCLAVEDTPAGIIAAVAAGMDVVAVHREGSDRSLLEAAGARVVSRLTVEDVLGDQGLGRNVPAADR